MIATRALGTACALLAVAVAGGCATDDGGGAGEGDTLTVYVSVPLRGPSGAFGHAIRDGARLALEDAGGKAGDVEIETAFLDDTKGGRWNPGVVGENARAASSDSTAIAYIGEFESGATRTSLPITNEARMLQVSPASTAVDLVSPVSGTDEVPERLQPSGERTFGRVIPDDEAQAAAGAAWAADMGVRDALALSTRGFGDVVADEFMEEAGELGLTVERPRQPRRGLGLLEPPPDLVYFAGPGPDMLPFVEGVARKARSATLMATDAFLMDPAVLNDDGAVERRLRLTAAAQDPAQLPPEGQRFVRAYRRNFGREPDPYAAYGYEAMAVVLDSIERAGTVDRTGVIDAFLDTTDRRSILGTYSIDEVGDTTLDRLAGYRVRAGRPAFEAPLRVP